MTTAQNVITTIQQLTGWLDGIIICGAELPPFLLLLT